ncbi:Collagen alpha-1 [Camelus dromedarius]|uniref:Collagen alpha-1 n=1 Tax=Camelus dromedarius TaxID=9838 RepID=A0A5N4CAK1_CAMDR|nr:Collagen alpha-1 [Camelus dromedarius]
MSELERAKLTLIPVLLQTRIGGQQNSVVLQKLKPDTPYTITLSSLCCDVEGGRMTGRGKTKPLNTSVYDSSTSTLNVRWEHTEQNPHQYKLFCAPTAGGLEELVTISCREKCVLVSAVDCEVRIKS